MKLITLTGASSVGKDFIVNTTKRLVPELKFVVSHTTRPMRYNEIQDREYHFIDIETATEMLNSDQFIETRQYNVSIGETWLYGIHKDEIELESDNVYIAIVDFQGLEKIKKYLRKNNAIDSLVSIYIDADYQTRLKRALSREGIMTNEQVEEVVRRFSDDILFVEPAKEHCDIVMHNNSVEDLIDIIAKIRELVNNE